MVAALRQASFKVVGTDIIQGVEFLQHATEMGVSAIITNPLMLWRESSLSAHAGSQILPLNTGSCPEFANRRDPPSVSG
jgi:hypothetical protein